MTARMKNKKGFTLAELLIVIAIIGILAGFGFVQVVAQQRRLKVKEADEAAKEIFMAAQNFLTAAWADGDLQNAISTYKPESEANGREFFGTAYIDTNNTTYGALSYDGHRGDQAPDGETKIVKDGVLDKILLPFGSVEEEIRTGGSYIIVYDIKSISVMQVFYSPLGNSSITENSFVKTRLGTVPSETGSLDSRVSEANQSGNKVDGKPDYVGYYDAVKAKEVSKNNTLQKASIKIHNDANLWVEVINPNPASASLEVTFTGLMSGHSITWHSGDTGWKTEVTGDSTFILLDSVTLGTENHFYSRFSHGKEELKKLYAGENIQASVRVTSGVNKKVLETTSPVFNSLFGSLVQSDPGENDQGPFDTAIITNIRHLENLNMLVSGLHPHPHPDLDISRARQDDDLDWEDFASSLAADVFKNSDDSSNVKVVNTGFVSAAKPLGTGLGYDAGCFYPVITDFLKEYDGNYHSISNIKVDTVNNVDSGLTAGGFAGIFSVFQNGSISNLKLEDVQITTKDGNAGALVGKIVNGSIHNVVVIENEPGVTVSGTTKTEPTSYVEDHYHKVTVSSGPGSAGGLVGEISAEKNPDASVQYGIFGSAASMLVSSASGDAGGLVGKISFGTGVTAQVFVDHCFAGGHTWKGNYSYDSSGTKVPIDNVTTTTGYAGGLVGNGGTAAITNSYSTCSVCANSYAGGLAGNASAASLENCYSLGQVRVTDTTNGKAGALIGKLSGTFSSGNNCYYYEIVNETVDANGVFNGYLAAVGDGSGDNLEALDANLTNYLKIASTAKSKAFPYDPLLKTQFLDSSQGCCYYPMKTVYELQPSTPATSSTERFVDVHYGDWPVLETLVINEPAGSST